MCSLSKNLEPDNVPRVHSALEQSDHTSVQCGIEALTWNAVLQTVNSKQFAAAPSAVHHLGIKARSNPSHEDWTSNQQCDLAGDQECDRYQPSIKTKRFDPFDSVCHLDEELFCFC